MLPISVTSYNPITFSKSNVILSENDKENRYNDLTVKTSGISMWFERWFLSSNTKGKVRNYIYKYCKYKRILKKSNIKIFIFIPSPLKNQLLVFTITIDHLVYTNNSLIYLYD